MEAKIKMVQCIICGKTISKRKSLAYANGRACRSHKEVTDLIEQKKETQKEGKISNNFKNLIITSLAIAQHKSGGTPLSMILKNIRVKYPEQYSEVKKNIEKQLATK